ncbi:MAG: class I SAM-dependent methyltransferase [Polyangiaceae bacterium]
MLALYYRIDRLVLERLRSRQEIFTRHYQTNFWGNVESASGAGSTLDYTKNVRTKLPTLVEDLAAKVLLDAPCGDWNWFRDVSLPADVKYIGGDIVAPLVARNRERFGDARHEFMVLDIATGKLPAADLWLCRDALFHLSNRDILRTLANFLRSDIRYLLTSSHTACTHNTDIVTGSFRELNLELPPFSLCPAALYVDDWVPGFPVRHLCLWERTVLATHLADHAALQALRAGG